MFGMIYKFIRDMLIGGNLPDSSIEEQMNDLAVILTAIIIICFVFILIRLVRWAFDIPFKSWRVRK